MLKKYYTIERKRERNTKDVQKIKNLEHFLLILNFFFVFSLSSILFLNYTLHYSLLFFIFPCSCITIKKNYGKSMVLNARGCRRNKV